MLLVAGATGSLGGRIMHELMERGESVRALVRTSSSHAALEAAGAEIAIGDLNDGVRPTSAADFARTRMEGQARRH